MNINTNPPAIEEQPQTEQEQHHTPEGSPKAAGDPIQNPRNQFKKVDEPKNIQFSARAKQKDADKLNELIAARSKKNARKMDIVDVALEMKDYIETDVFQTFTTK